MRHCIFSRLTCLSARLRRALGLVAPVGLVTLFLAGVLLAGRAMPTGSSLLPDTLTERLADRYGPAVGERLYEWDALLLAQRGNDAAQRLVPVNGFLNRLEFVSDQQHWQKADYWATPAEFLASGGGDCEDFAIAKLFSLYLTGMGTDRLRLMYVEAVAQRQAHMVLLYTPEGGEPLVLDNLDGRVLPASVRTDLKPVYSFNGAGLWLNNQPGGEVPVARYRGSRMWDDLVARMRAEGFDL